MTYTATALPGGQSCTTTTTSCSISNLSPTTAYSIQVTATNNWGTGTSGTSTLSWYPIDGSKLQVVPLTTQPFVPAGTTLSVVAGGAAPGAVVTLSAAGQSAQCTALATGQCVVTVTTHLSRSQLKASYTANKHRFSATSAAALPVPIASSPSTFRHDHMAKVAVRNCVPAAPVTWTWTDGTQTVSITAMAGTTGQVSAAIAVPHLPGVTTLTVTQLGATISTTSPTVM